MNKPKEVERVETVSMYEEMDTDTNKNEPEQMEVGSQPAMDQMEVEEVVVGNSMVEVKVGLGLGVEGMQVEVEGQVEGRHHGDGDEGDGDRRDVPGVGVSNGVQKTQVQPSRPQAQWKAFL